jgi:hypothetical protein
MITRDQRLLIEMVKRWRTDNHDLRFAQWIFALCGARDPFHVEDDELATLMGEWFERGSDEVDGHPQDPMWGSRDLLEVPE